MWMFRRMFRSPEQFYCTRSNILEISWKGRKVATHSDFDVDVEARYTLRGGESVAQNRDNFNKFVLILYVPKGCEENGSNSACTAFKSSKSVNLGWYTCRLMKNKHTIILIISTIVNSSVPLKVSFVHKGEFIEVSSVNFDSSDSYDWSDTFLLTSPLFFLVRFSAIFYMLYTIYSACKNVQRQNVEAVECLVAKL